MPHFIGIENIRLPRGTNLVINVYGLHRKPEIWGADAHLFNPDRFNPLNKENERHPYSFLPFANGMRLCIGNEELI